MPPALACRFTVSELAVLRIIGDEVRQHGHCVGEIAARAGVCRRMVQSAHREAARMRQALLEPLRCIHGVSHKILSMALADLLLGADPDRERWLTTGASMVAVDTLVHNWLHRTGILRRLGAEHAYGPACYRPGGCASIIEEAAHHIDARQFCPEGPAFFPRLVHAAPQIGPSGRC